jgi:secreted PhoX family phosphatase
MSYDQNKYDQDKADFDALIAWRLNRRTVLGGVIAASAFAATPGISWRGAQAQQAAAASSLSFEELPHGLDETFHVAPAHNAQILIRWGDPLFADAPAFDPLRQTAAAQEQQFGFNNDFVAFMPLPPNSKKSDHGLLCVNHEFTNATMMFPGLVSAMQAGLERAVGVTAQAAVGQMPELSREQVEVEMAAHGHSVVEIKLHNGEWRPVIGSPFNRRLTALSTPMRLSGPAAGHDRLKTTADPSGATVIGTLNNCGGGVTPWGTVLIAEENFNFYFAGNPSATAEAGNHARYGIGESDPRFQWARFHDRFNVEKEPNEPNRFGWIVELDPFNSKAIPVKRTALGRLKHEAATISLAPDGRVVAYTGDDERFQYIYRYVSTGRYDPRNREANMTLLDDGILSVARFEADGRLIWMPLIFGAGPLTAQNGFASQADILIETRRAAELLGATRMDRPEDIETNPVNGRVYVVLTKNDKREEAQKDAANPRAKNAFGHVLELTPPGAEGQTPDHAADEFGWDIFLLAGDPSDVGAGARYHPQTSQNGWLTTPDNIAFDSRGRMWIATDGGNDHGLADGVWATDVQGPGRALTRHFLHGPRGAEMCGPCFTPNDASLFVAVQHPGQEPGSSYDAPSTRWPDFDKNMPPRPAIVAITAKGKPVGG